MFKKIIILSVVVLLGLPNVSYAAKDPNRVTVFNRVGDWFATVGKSEQHKSMVLKRRKKLRRSSREFKARQNKGDAIQKKMDAQNKAILDKVYVRRTPHGR